MPAHESTIGPRHDKRSLSLEPVVFLIHAELRSPHATAKWGSAYQLYTAFLHSLLRTRSLEHCFLAPISVDHCEGDSGLIEAYGGFNGTETERDEAQIRPFYESTDVETRYPSRLNL